MEDPANQRKYLKSFWFPSDKIYEDWGSGLHEVNDQEKLRKGRLRLKFTEQYLLFSDIILDVKENSNKVFSVLMIF